MKSIKPLLKWFQNNGNEITESSYFRNRMKDDANGRSLHHGVTHVYLSTSGLPDFYCVLIFISQCREHNRKEYYFGLNREIDEILSTLKSKFPLKE